MIVDPTKLTANILLESSETQLRPAAILKHFERRAFTNSGLSLNGPSAAGCLYCITVANPELSGGEVNNVVQRFSATWKGLVRTS